MAKDYAYRTSPNKRPAKQPNWRPRTPAGKPPVKNSPSNSKSSLIIAIILLIIVAVCGTLYFKHHGLKFSLHHTTSTAPKKITLSSTGTASTQQQSVQFDFYTTLPAASPNVTPPVQSSTVTPSPSTATTSSYILQLGSLATMDDAVSLQDKLQAAGFNDIHIIRIEHGGTVWYRVQMGPYSDKSFATSMQQKLQQQNFDSVVQPVS